MTLSEQVAALEEREKLHVQVIAALCTRFGSYEHPSYPGKLHISFEDLKAMETQGIAEYAYQDSIAISLVS